MALKVKSPYFKKLAAAGEKLPFTKAWKPMLATKVEKPFDNEEWIFEPKWDGYRILAKKNKKSIVLHTRELRDYTSIYHTISDTLHKLPFSFILDGEVIMLDDEGKASYDKLQQVATLGAERLVYCVFDILWLDGYSLLNMELLQRKKILAELIKDLPNVLLTDFTRKAGTALYKQMLEKDWEGIVAKKATGSYLPGKRVMHWLKVPTKKRQEFVIGGWTESGSGREFRSLLFGYYQNGKLIFDGHSGGGYTDKTFAQLKPILEKLEIKKSPFTNTVETSTKPHWVKPLLVAEFEYATRTASGKIRKPAIFKGLRKDKSPEDVVLEVAVERTSSGAERKKKKPFLSFPPPGASSNWPELKENLAKGSINTLKVEGKELSLHHIERVLWSESEITKGDLLKYYIDIAPYLLPYLKYRPLSLHIKHNGVNAPGMYIKDMEGNQPGWAETYGTERKHKKKGKSDIIDYLVINDNASLLYHMDLGCIDINPWNSTIKDPLNPDYLVIDLDPSDDDFKKVIEAARASKKILDKLKIRAYPKTSGKTGLHIFIPVASAFTFPQARTIVSILCALIHELIPDISSINDSIAGRGNKVFLDDNQNDYSDTLASAYSVRPYKFPNVSAPLEWKEIKPSLKPESFNIFSMQKRLRAKGDIFKPVLSKGIGKANAKILSQFLK